MKKLFWPVYSEPSLHHYDKCQFAYRPKSSTSCALLTTHEIVINFLDDINVGAVRVITFDTFRAFDRVPHLTRAQILNTR